MRSLLAFALVATLALTTFADENPRGKKKGERIGKTNPMVTKLISGLKEAGLSEEQMTKVQAAAKTLETKIKELRENGLNGELHKKRVEAAKAARDAGLKGKELAAKVNESLTADEQKLFAQLQTATVQMKKSIASVLTEEQTKALPENLRKQLKPRGHGSQAGEGNGRGKAKRTGNGAGKGKGKKKDAA